MGKAKMMTVLKGSIQKKKYWGFDIETYGKFNDFLMGCIIGDDNVKEIFWDKEEFIKYLLKNGKIFRQGFITATNLNFDLLALFSHTAIINRIKPVIRNSQMLLCSLPYEKSRNCLKFIDSWNFAKMSVKKMGDIIGVPKLKQPEFLGKKQYLNKRDKNILENYNIRDAYITYRFMKFLQEGFNNLGGEMKITLPSTTMNLFRRKYLDMTLYHQKKPHLDIIYKGYYGGRTEIIKRGRVRNIRYYDINSMYPAAMINDFPMPNRYKHSKVTKLSTIMEYEGMAMVKFEAPKIHIPYIPHKEEKLLFPIGTMTGYYTFFEIRKALELGYTIKKLYDSVIFFKTFRPFDNFAKELYSLKLKYKLEKSSMENIVKLALNSLYGKFAQKIDSKEIIIPLDEATKEVIDSYDNIFRSGNFFIAKKPYDKIPCFINPIFSAYITAYARDLLYNHMKKTGFENIYYYDTDSIFTDRYIEDSDRLGSMKYEMKIKKGVLVKPKMYIADEYIKCKGVSNLDISGFNDILDNKPVKITKFVKFKEANKRNLQYNQILSFNKYIDLEDNKRGWPERFNPDILQESEPIMI